MPKGNPMGYRKKVAKKAPMKKPRVTKKKK